MISAKEAFRQTLDACHTKCMNTKKAISQSIEEWGVKLLHNIQTEISNESMNGNEGCSIRFTTGSLHLPMTTFDKEEVVVHRLKQLINFMHQLEYEADVCSIKGSSNEYILYINWGALFRSEIKDDKSTKLEIKDDKPKYFKDL